MEQTTYLEQINSVLRGIKSKYGPYLLPKYPDHILYDLGRDMVEIENDYDRWKIEIIAYFSDGYPIDIFIQKFYRNTRKLCCCYIHIEKDEDMDTVDVMERHLP